MAVLSPTTHTLPWVRARSWSVPAAALLPLFTILLLQSIASLGLQNTAFQDEALYLYAGRQIFDQLLGGPTVIEPYARYFSGLPYLYPVLAGGLERIWGLEAARLLSLGCMLWATAAVYLLTSRLFDRTAAPVAAALFAVQAPVLFLGHFATYDAMCLALLALASVLAVAGAAWRTPFVALAVGGALLLAVGTKYAGLLFVPTVLALQGWLVFRRQGWRQALLRTALSVAVIVLGAAAVLHYDHDVLVGVSTTTTNRQAIQEAARLLLLQRAVTLGGALTVVALVGLLISDRSRRLLALLLFGTVLLAPAYHIYKQEASSLHKHIAFGLFFAAPLAGYALARLTGLGADLIDRRWLSGLAICLLLFGQGLQQAQHLYAEWPDSSKLVQVLRTQVRPGTGRILAEESEVPRYYLQDIVSFWQWTGLYFFEYTDRAGHHLSGIPAYKAAIAEGYFDVVVLRYGPTASTDYAIDSGLRDGRRYSLIAKIPYYTMFGAGDYWVWRRRSDGVAAIAG